MPAQHRHTYGAIYEVMLATAFTLLAFVAFVLADHPSGFRVAEQAPFYIYAAFVLVYATKVSGASRDFVLTASCCDRSVSGDHPAVRACVGPDRPQAPVSDWRGRDRRARIRLFRDDGHSAPRLDFPRLHRVPSRLDHRWRPGATDRDGAVRCDWIWLIAGYIFSGLRALGVHVTRFS